MIDIDNKIAKTNKGLGTHKAGIHVTFKEIRLVKLISSSMPHQFEMRLCEVLFDRGEVSSITPIDFNLTVTDLDSTDNSELLRIWREKVKPKLDYWFQCSEEACGKPLLEVTIRD